MPPSRQARAARIYRSRGERRGAAVSLDNGSPDLSTRINFIMISEKNRGRPCRYHAEESLPQECPYPSAYRGCASFPFCWHCIIHQKADGFGTGRTRTQSVRTRRNDVPIVLIVEDHALFRSGETAHRHRARPDGRGRGGGRARRHPARAVAPARSHPTGYFHARTQRRGGHTPYQGGCAGSAHPYRFHARHSRACTRGPESRSRRLPAQNGGRGRVPQSPSGPCSREGSTSALSSPGP